MRSYAQRDGAAKFIIANEVLPSRSASAQKQFFLGRRIPIFTTVGIRSLGMADTRSRVSAPLARPAPIPQHQVGGLAPPLRLVGLVWRDT